MSIAPSLSFEVIQKKTEINMALHATTTLQSFTHDHQLEHNDDMDGRCDDHQVVNLSRLSVSNSICMYGSNGDNSAELYENGAGSMSVFMSQMSIESFEGDADDEEFSDEKINYKLEAAAELSSSSDSEPGFYSLPATPPRIRRKSGSGLAIDGQVMRAKDYASENEAKKCTRDGSLVLRRKHRRRRIEGNRRLLNRAEDYNTAGNNWMRKEEKGEDKTGGIKKGYSGGESESNGVMLIARPKGGRRSMCMDLEEVKACRDLGFELEMPSRVSISAGSTADTSNGGNSPIAHWHISSPGDDPRHVKARLKRWAQAVALASTSGPTTS